MIKIKTIFYYILDFYIFPNIIFSKVSIKVRLGNVTALP